jgi:phosphohistidine swiveling domain-containing protein
MDADDLLPQLRDAAVRLEACFQDMCDVEFTVQEGILYVLQARRGRPHPLAALRIATDLFVEGTITGKTLVERVTPAQVEAILKPGIALASDTKEIGRGMSASPGAATGVAVFSADAALQLHERGGKAIFICAQMTPDDVHGVDAAEGMLTLFGGMTSHAAVCCRGRGKPCVTGLGWSFDRSGRSIRTPKGRLSPGDPVTFDGTTGVVYSGTADIVVPKAMENDRLRLLLRVIDVLSAERELPPASIGNAWLIRDIMTHGSSSRHRIDELCLAEKWPEFGQVSGRAFGSLSRTQVRQLVKEVRSFAADRDRENLTSIWFGLRTFLLRLLSKHVGVGRHPEFLRPLFDPIQTVIAEDDSAVWRCRGGNRIQIVGEEFFCINTYVPELIDISTIRVYWAVECDSPRTLWRVDRTNPRGEKLLQGSGALRCLKVVVNDASVPLATLGAFYNSLRRREYFWTWYAANDTSRRELVHAMTEPDHKDSSKALVLAERAGLITKTGTKSPAGESLVQPTTASLRAAEHFRVGW